MVSSLCRQPHLTPWLQGFTTTSIGPVVQKAGFVPAKGLEGRVPRRCLPAVAPEEVDAVTSFDA